jgi:hypothetical protein
MLFDCLFNKALEFTNHCKPGHTNKFSYTVTLTVDSRISSVRSRFES